jgi:FtsP/CotA-like multicopper oxidase with cupredoxin domain
MISRSALFVIAVMLAGTGLGIDTAAAADRGSSLAPAGWDAAVRLNEPVDRNPDPKVLEIDLVARVAAVEVAPGLRVKAWTYDGGLPGPLIRARIGDRLVVHFTNQLPQPTTIHWHGVRVPIEMDGVPNISQPDVKPASASPLTSCSAMQASTGITRT